MRRVRWRLIVLAAQTTETVGRQEAVAVKLQRPHHECAAVPLAIARLTIVRSGLLNGAPVFSFVGKMTVLATQPLPVLPFPGGNGVNLTVFAHHGSLYAPVGAPDGKIFPRSHVPFLCPSQSPIRRISRSDKQSWRPGWRTHQQPAGSPSRPARRNPCPARCGTSPGSPDRRRPPGQWQPRPAPA